MASPSPACLLADTSGCHRPATLPARTRRMSGYGTRRPTRCQDETEGRDGETEMTRACPLACLPTRADDDAKPQYPPRDEDTG